MHVLSQYQYRGVCMSKLPKTSCLLRLEQKTSCSLGNIWLGFGIGDVFSKIF